MINAVIYARYSSHGQTEQSIEGQIAVCREFAKKNNYRIINEYVDRALTGTNDRRPGFQKMIEDSKSKTFFYIIVYQLDRFARDRYDSAIYKNKLKKNGVRVLSAKENITSDASGILMESVLEGMAEYYSAELRQKVIRGKNISASKFKYLGGTRNYGFTANKEQELCVVEEEAKVVRMIYEMYADGTPVKRIMEHLNSLGIPNSTGRKWTINPIHSILLNKKYNGYYVYNGIETEGKLPKIIDDELFNKVQNMKKKNKNTSGGNKSKVPYYLTGKLYCGECERGMVGCSGTSKLGTKYNYYKCLTRLKDKSCELPPIPKEYLEQVVIDNVKTKMTDKIIEEVSHKVYEELCEENGKKIIDKLSKQLENTQIKLKNT